MAIQYPLGTDISCVADLDPELTLVSGTTALAQAIARRLQTPRGGLWYDREYGTDLRQFVNGNLSSGAKVAAAVKAEALKDERVQSVSVVVTVAGRTMTVQIAGRAGDGPFKFTLGVDAVTVKLLGVET